MGRELQKKKNRSSLNKVRRKPKSKKLTFGNSLIAKNWDKSLTLSQNYKKLGLTVGLDKPAGGQEKTVAILNEQAARASQDKLTIDSKLPTTIVTSEARVERDPKTGEILRIIEDESSLRAPNPLDDQLNDVEEDSAQQDGAANVFDGCKRPQTKVVQELELIAASGERKKPRHQSAREKEWVEALVEKYGDNYASMFRDRKLNPMQQSEGQIKRKVLDWKKANAT